MSGGTSARVWTLLALALACAGCALPQEVGSDCGDDAQCMQAEVAAGRVSGGGSSSMPGARSSDVPRGGYIERADVLFVINDSPAMEPVQNALARAIPAFVRALATGDSDLGGRADFRAATDLHLGVINGRMHAGGDELSGAPGCIPSAGTGGELIRSCLATDTHFASTAGADTLGAAADDLACMAQVGRVGCESPQPFEAALKALWPSSGPVPAMTFSDATSSGPSGNLGFLRRDSLIVVIVVSDIDDCSSLQPGELRAARSPERLLHRCSVRPDVRAPLDRYLLGLRGLRAGAEDLVMFFALAGIPVLKQMPRFDRDDEREAYYQALFDHPGMQPGVVDVLNTPADGDDDIPPALCATGTGTIYPAPRMVELARRFSLDGMVLSLCQPDLQGTLREIARSIGRRLGPPAL